MTTQFDDFKKLLDIATKDVNFVRTNTAMQDSTYATAIATRVSALNEHHNFELGSDDVESVNGLVINDTEERAIKLSALALKDLVVSSLEHDVMTPVKIWVRKDGSGVTLSDGIRYIITCSDVGVLFANESGELIGSLPGFGDQANDGYDSATAAISITANSTEYIAVAMDHDIVRIYDMSDWSLTATIGTLDTPGLPDADDLTSPIDLAYDETNEVLYIACNDGTATGASGVGFVCSFDVSTPATPVFGSYLAINDGGKLLHGQVSKPPSIQYDATNSSLWVVSLDDSGATNIYELGALQLSTNGQSATGALAGYIKTKQYLYEIKDIFLDDTKRKLYVAGWNSVEVFNADTLVHLNSYGYYAQEYSSTPSQVPPVTRMNFSTLGALAADTITISSIAIDILLTSDSNRIIRTSENIFDVDNYAEFLVEEPVVPVSLEGFLIKGTLPSQNIIVQYKTSSTGDWHTLDNVCSATPSTYYKFRIKLFAGPYDALQDYTLERLIIVGRQA